MPIATNTSSTNPLGRLSVSQYLENEAERPVFRIAKKARLSARLLEIMLAICQFVAFSGIGAGTLTMLANPQSADIAWAAMIIGFLAALAASSLYLFPAVFKWKPRTVLLVESFLDLSMLVLFLAAGIVMSSAGGCPAGTATCNKFNVTMVTMYIGFIFWATSFLFDVQGLHTIYKSNNSY